MIKRYRWTTCLFFASILIALFMLPNPALAQEVDLPQGNQHSPQQALEQPQPNLVAGAQPEPVEKRAPDQGANDQSTNSHSTGAQSQPSPPIPANDRLFGVLPNFLTVENEAQVPPLTPGGKFKIVAKDAFDPVIYPFIGFVALIAQAQNSNPEFGQGMSGYAKRYGVAFGDATIGSFMTGAVFPSLLKQDPRYFQLGHGGFRHRVGYSVSRIFITRTDSGGSQFNTSEIAGNLVAAGISNAYIPAQERSVTNTLTNWGTDTGWDTLSNLAKEFWPDVRRYLKRKF